MLVIDDTQVVRQQDEVEPVEFVVQVNAEAGVVEHTRAIVVAVVRIDDQFIEVRGGNPGEPAQSVVDVRGIPAQCVGLARGVARLVVLIAGPVGHRAHAGDLEKQLEWVGATTGVGDDKLVGPHLELFD